MPSTMCCVRHLWPTHRTRTCCCLRIPPCFAHEGHSFAAGTARGTYAKVVSMDYLARQLARFFVAGSCQAVDVISDVYFVSQLYTSPVYDGVSSSLKTTALCLLALSLVLWFAVSFHIANSFKANLGFEDGLPRRTSLLTLLSTAVLVAFDCPLFLITAPQRTVKVADITSERDPKVTTNSLSCYRSTRVQSGRRRRIMDSSPTFQRFC